MNQLLQKLSIWLAEEQHILDEMAHDVANSDSVEEMVITKQAYSIQSIKVETIIASIKYVEYEQK